MALSAGCGDEETTVAWMVFNFVGFQAVWWACVLGAGANQAWAGPIALGLYAALHFRWSPAPARDVRLLLAAVLLGMVLDSTLAASGLLAYAAATSTSFAPIWILALWAGFALTLKHSMAWFAHRPYAAATFGLLGGPMAYAGAGAVAGAVSFPLGTGPALAAVAVAWALALPLLYWADASSTRPRLASSASTLGSLPRNPR